MSAEKWIRKHPVAVGIIFAILILVWMLAWIWGAKGDRPAAVLQDNGLLLLGGAAATGLIATIAVVLDTRFSKDRD